MKFSFIRIVALILLAIGLFISLSLLVMGGVLLFIYFPEGDLQKKILVAGGFVIAAFLTCLFALALYEFLFKFVRVEEEVEEISEEVKKIEEQTEKQTK